ncbi:MAG: GNAT family N-acetyltransferase [Actinomycetota bacterium]
MLDLVALGGDNGHTTMTTTSVRDSVPEDIAYLVELRQQLQAADWWLGGWPREGDIAVIATNEAGDRIGAAWCRRESVPQVVAGVSEDYRRQGVAETLLHALADRAAALGVSVLHATVWNSNTGALRLALKVGFVERSVVADRTELLWNLSDVAIQSGGVTLPRRARRFDGTRSPALGRSPPESHLPL